MRADLLAAYRELNAYPDAREALHALKQSGKTTGIQSNGSPGMLQAAVDAAGIGGMLDHVLSVDVLRVYKPRHEVYALVTKALSMQPEEVVFVSSNRWDVAGAAGFGFKPVWVNRSKMPDEYPDLAPIATLDNLAALSALEL